MTELEKSYVPLIGRRLRLIHMNDPYPVPDGTEGTIVGVGGGQLIMDWDIDRSLNVDLEHDKFEILD
jgi:hypothetical protein